ncbi:MAG: peptidase M15 [Caulobacter sp. 12-67-6]|nr:MAG: peptidase M15 [Caulobacter sp. 12-67-6]OYX72696.1 MAG: peptidase M15 [Caulobacter sp. 32-67-35]OYX95559.1 MAG: peptidase M15 [Caulobacter sp. 35-67-4]
MKLLRRLAWTLGIVALTVAAFTIWVIWPGKAPVPPPLVTDPPPPWEQQGATQYIPSVDPPAAAPFTARNEACDTGAAPPGAAAVNAASLTTMVWSPFGRPEVGWEIYAPRIAAEIDTACAPDTRRFAALLAKWQQSRGLKPTGVMDLSAFQPMLTGWHLQRPFVRVNNTGICPGAPLLSGLNTAKPNESYGGKTIQLRPGALEAYRRMVAEARAAGVIQRPETLTIFSGFREPAADAARCERDNNCQGLVRTICSAHRTGLALDIYIATAPGFGPDSSADDNRRAMARSAVFRWMVVNAGRFGFVNYAYEPWHWEWTGEPLLPGVPIKSLSQAGSAPVEPAPSSIAPLRQGTGSAVVR